MKKGIIIGAIILAVLILGSGIYYYFVMLPAQYAIPMQNQNINGAMPINLNQVINTMPIINATPVPPTNLNVNAPALPVNAPPPPPPVSTSKTWQISIQNFAFNPPTITINSGDTVKWTNNDVAPHQIASNGILSKVLYTGDSFSFSFSAPGSYPYHCNIHTFMTGVIIIQ